MNVDRPGRSSGRQPQNMIGNENVELRMTVERLKQELEVLTKQNLERMSLTPMAAQPQMSGEGEYSGSRLVVKVVILFPTVKVFPCQPARMTRDTK